MMTKPVRQVRPIDPAGCEIEHEILLVIEGGVNLAAVENEKGLHCRVSNALVAIDERVILNQREAQGCGLLGHRGVQVDSTPPNVALG
jgi:hypothetical protein